MRFGIRAVTLAVIGLMLAACGGGGGGGEGQSDKHIRILGIGSSLDFGAIDVAKWQQNLEAKGFTVDLKFVEEEDAALRAVVAGAADVYIGSLPAVITAVQSTQAPVKLVAVNAQASDYVVLASNAIEQVSDLAGKTIAVNTPGSAGDTIMKLALEAEGFDNDSAKFVVIGGSGARVAALQAGQVDATVAHLAAAEAAVATGAFKALLYTGPAVGPYSQSGLIASDDWINRDPAITQEAVDALIDAERWAATDKDGYIELSKSVDKEIDDSVRGSAYDQFVDIDFFGVNGGLDPEQIDNFLKLSLEAGDISGPAPDKSAWLDDTFTKAYVEKNGRV